METGRLFRNRQSPGIPLTLYWIVISGRGLFPHQVAQLLGFTISFLYDITYLLRWAIEYCGPGNNNEVLMV